MKRLLAVRYDFVQAPQEDGGGHAGSGQAAECAAGRGSDPGGLQPLAGHVADDRQDGTIAVATTWQKSPPTSSAAR